jgi:integrase
VVNVPGVRPGQTSTRTVYGTLADAEAEKAIRRAAGRPRPVVSPGTLGELAAGYFAWAETARAANTVRNSEDEWRRRIGPYLGHAAAETITPATLADLFVELARAGATERMLVESRKVLRAIFRWAIERGDLEGANPASRLEIPDAVKRPPARTRFALTGTEVELLLGAARTPRSRTLILVAVEAGLRKGELLGLRFGDLDLPGQRIRVSRQIVQERGPDGPIRIERPTKGRRARTVAITGRVAQELGAFMEHEVIDRGRPADGYLWPGRAGEGPTDHTAPNTLLRRLLDRAGLPEDLIDFHGLRRTAATLALLAGAPLAVVSRQLGHASITVTADHYEHVLSDDLDLFARAFEPAPDPDPKETPR